MELDLTNAGSAEPAGQHPPRRRIIHLHVPKTAGTALRVAFQEQYKDRLRVFPHYDERKYQGINPDDYDIFSGHIGFKTASEIGGDMITVLREPVDRFLSVYYFWRELFDKGVEINRKTQLAKRYPLDEFALIRDEPILNEEFDNRITYQFAHGSSLEHRHELKEMVSSEDEIFRLALKHLGSVALVGIQERMDEFATSLHQCFGVKLHLQRINVTEKREAVADIRVRTLKAIQDRLFMDIELYHYATRRHHDQYRMP